ncbi:MAG: tetraacyldisaccharide 4'-kinase, partial [Capnocytophaga sp.]|nr:tetraacyldisaccharide 4'-kinase [Capnocytophaga sp.]
MVLKLGKYELFINFASKKEVIQLIRYLLAPIVVIYGIIIRLRHWGYDYGLFKSVSFSVPTICVGNISVGGTGKTPMVEYLIRQLLPHYRVGVVSRGYKRKTKGQVLADANSTVYDLGDEPFQFWKKYPEISLVVDSDRVNGIDKLMNLPSSPEVILLDDAFQHRKVKAQKNVLLTAYNDLYTDDYLLPMGNLRDIKARVSNADVIVVTKCPSNISDTERSQIVQKIQRKP